jgi:hypothetical protein
MTENPPTISWLSVQGQINLHMSYRLHIVGGNFVCRLTSRPPEKIQTSILFYAFPNILQRKKGVVLVKRNTLNMKNVFKSKQNP